LHKKSQPTIHLSLSNITKTPSTKAIAYLYTMPHTTKHLGIGAVVSFQSKFIHPHSLRDEHFQDRPSGHRLADAVVVRREEKMINHKNTMCVIVHHDDFVDEDGKHQELWCAETHVKLHKEGDSDHFFDVSHSETRKVDDDSDDLDDIENQKTTSSYTKKHHHGKRKSIDPNGFDDPLRPREGRDLMWRNVNMILTSGKKNSNEPDKKLLDNVWGDVPSKQVTAIMGPSGE
jgi:hypothetical protein